MRADARLVGAILLLMLPAGALAEPSMRDMADRAEAAAVRAEKAADRAEAAALRVEKATERLERILQKFEEQEAGAAASRR
jgi:hypothetical protein